MTCAQVRIWSVRTRWCMNPLKRPPQFAPIITAAIAFYEMHRLWPWKSDANTNAPYANLEKWWYDRMTRWRTCDGEAFLEQKDDFYESARNSESCRQEQDRKRCRAHKISVNRLDVISEPGKISEETIYHAPTQITPSHAWVNQINCLRSFLGDHVMNARYTMQDTKIVMKISKNYSVNILGLHERHHSLESAWLCEGDLDFSPRLTCKVPPQQNANCQSFIKDWYQLRDKKWTN